MPQTVLIADDDPSFSTALARLLGPAGYRILKVHSGDKAVSLIERMPGEIQLLVVDLVMPGQGGFETIRILKRGAPRLKIIAVSAHIRELYAETARTLGAHAVLRKPAPGEPLDETTWLGAVRNLLAEV